MKFAESRISWNWRLLFRCTPYGLLANIDTATSNGKLIFGIFPALAEFEH